MSFIFPFQTSSPEMDFSSFVMRAHTYNRILELYMSMFFSSVHFILYPANLGITHGCGCYSELCGPSLCKALNLLVVAAL